MNIDLGRSVTYIFDDPGWRPKLIVFLIVGFVPGLNLLLWSGYALSVARNMARGAAQPLPTWDAWTDIAVRGLLSIVAILAYLLPLGCCWLIMLIGPVFGLNIGGLRLIGVVVSLFYVLAANYVLTSGHVRFALTDQFYPYLEMGGRLRDVRLARGVFWPLFLVQSVITFLLLLLLLVMFALSLVALSAIYTLGGIAGVLLAGLLAVGLLGLVALVTVAFLANGYIVGGAASAFLSQILQS